jgi:RimJ/RimL family protein N-acetyltransferase
MSASLTSTGWTRRAALRDGTPVLLRQIQPEDRDRLAQGLQELSATSRYLRFHADIEELSPAELDHLTQVDHHDHEAIVAIDLDRPETPGVGVARYVRDHFERSVAEAVVTVADRYHGQGAATLLFGALAARARSEGIEVLRHDVLDENPVMLAFLEHLGATRVRATEDRWQVDLRLPVHVRDLPTNPAARAFGRAMRERTCLQRLARPVRRARGTTAASSLTERIASELAAQDGDHAAATWLAERERRQPRWPSLP